MKVNLLWSDLVARLHVGRPDQLVDWLVGVALFEGLQKPHLRHLARVMHRRAFEPDEPIFRQGDIGSGMYLIHSGRVRIVAEDPVRGEVQLAILESGHAFGEMALFDHAPRSATAVAHGEAVLYGLFEADLDQLERTRPQAAARLLRNLGLSIALRLRQTNERLQEMEEGSPRGPF